MASSQPLVVAVPEVEVLDRVSNQAPPTSRKMRPRMPWKSRIGVRSGVDQREAELEVGEEGAVADRAPEVDAAQGVETAEVDRTREVAGGADRRRARNAKLLRRVNGNVLAEVEIDARSRAYRLSSSVGGVAAAQRRSAAAARSARPSEDRGVAHQGAWTIGEVVLAGTMIEVPGLPSELRPN